MPARARAWSPGASAWRARRCARFRDEPYWGRPVPGFGDPDARILLVGLAPAAHGGNRTGRVFTGDASGDFLWPALHRAGLADRAVSRRADDGLTLRDVRTSRPRSAARRRPTSRPSEERDTCAPFLARELGAAGPACGSSWPWARSAGMPRCGCWPTAGHARRRRGGRPAFGHWPRRRIGPYAAPRLVPPEPAEHVHRPPDAADARCRSWTAPRARRRLAADRSRPRPAVHP